VPEKVGPDPERFLTDLLEKIEATGRWPGALKPNLAYFEQYGSKGLQMLERLLERWAPKSLIILDAKRGDIGPSSRAYARAVFDTWGADAVTVSPWMGWDSLEPFLEYEDKGVYVLLRTSNPGAKDLQDHVWERLAEQMASRKRPALGAVVGATRPEDLQKALELDIPLLIPGVGTQGGDIPQGLAPMHRVNVSSGILYAEDPVERFLHYHEALQPRR
jgi:orotidine-5'-phosphate decarboxylase